MIVFLQQKKKWENTNWLCFFPKFHSQQKIGTLLPYQRRANLRKSNFDNNQQIFEKNLKHLISPSGLNIQLKIKICGGSFYNRPKPFRPSGRAS